MAARPKSPTGFLMDAGSGFTLSASFLSACQVQGKHIVCVCLCACVCVCVLRSSLRPPQGASGPALEAAVYACMRVCVCACVSVCLPDDQPGKSETLEALSTVEALGAEFVQYCPAAESPHEHHACCTQPGNPLLCIVPLPTELHCSSIAARSQVPLLQIL